MVKKRGNRWYYDLMIRRVRYRGVIPEALNKAQAKRAEDNIRLAIYAGKYGGEPGETLLRTFVDDVYLPWATLNKRHPKDDRLHCRVICDYFAGKAFRDISPMLIEKFKKDRRESITRRETQRSPASVNRELEVLSKIFSLACDNGVTDSNPCRKVRKLRQDNQRKRYLSPDEEIRLMDALTGRRAHLKPLVAMAIHTGMRRGELLKLSWRHVDFARGLLYVTDTKTGHDRVVPMNSTVRETLLKLQESSGSCEYVFINPNTGARLTDVKHGFTSACSDAKIEDFHFHDLRHTTGTRLADSGVDAFAIAELLGHRDLQTTKRYTHATEARRRSAVED
ncbi:MAG: tyrosine-type recombinase/integrase, partial [Blastocatellia bacterium]